jgi:TolB-like protein/Flp pilus assembly protein TadD
LTNEPGLDGNPTTRGSQRAVFLSYASEDAEAARRICAALRAAGLEVWFDQSELRGGDAWDSAIRKQIKSCALFIPIISSNTHTRIEGYFRLEWKLAVDRSHLLAPDQAFLVPVAIDQTPQSDERLPDRFRELQWTRLPDGNTPPAFVERIARLLSPDTPGAHVPSRAEVDAPAGGTARISAAAGSAEAARSPRPVPQARKALWLIALAVLVGAGCLALYTLVISKRASDAGRTPDAAFSAGPATQSAIPEKSIAVLPFVDMSEKKDQEYFSDGLAEELLDLLAQVPDLRVPARTSSFYFKGRSDDIATIAQKLRVAHVLEGSVRRAGTTIRVTAQLIRADNGYHLWSRTYDRDLKDIFRVQDEIASSVVDALKAQLLPSQQIASRHRTTNTEAYTEYLMGNKFRERDTSEANQSALAAYQKAVTLDPTYAAAYSGLADAEWRVADQLTSEPAAYQRALAAADQAITLAPESPDGYWARGRLRLLYLFDWSGADGDFRKALQIDANDIRVLRDYSGLLAVRGQSADAVTMLHRALALDPLSITVWRALGQLLTDTGPLSEARFAAHRVAELSPDAPAAIYLLGRIDVLDGRPQVALTELKKVPVGFSLVDIAMAEHSLGHEIESQRALEELIRQHSNMYAYQIAEVYSWRGERDKAFEWLERAYRQRDGGMTYVTYDRILANLRGDARYRALLRKLKLAD